MGKGLAEAGRAQVPSPMKGSQVDVKRSEQAETAALLSTHSSGEEDGPRWLRGREPAL